ncbi:hypothetical protein DMNBHIDG_02358 [Candidatus Methanoperedenaceae archaeon GB37]|nr:hypothetical protein DMNBHIDG_02358 [Candidatus Methanoperedenaceae archaeon GB37]
MRYMKNLGMFFCTIILVFMLGGVTEAATYTFEPTPADLDDLDHSSYYTWGIDWNIPAGEIIVSASLSFDDIRNWNKNPTTYGYIFWIRQPQASLVIGTTKAGVITLVVKVFYCTIGKTFQHLHRI